MSIVLEHLTKSYGGHPVVHQVSLEVADGEFFVLLGASGSGKSTILRMIAGLSSIDLGRVLLHGRDVSHLPPQARGTGFVFQNYALFQHMSVADNIEFGLRIRKASSAERRRRRDELLELVGLAGLGKRLPRQLSGGQQQRVALARALAYRPEVLLLDEPFGALDAKIRVELRRSMREIQRELGVTTIFVTHDQEEAFELGDRLGVMNFGRLLEVGSPTELYQRPQTEYVATFLGSANLLVGQVTPKEVQLGPLQFPLTTESAQHQQDQRVQVLFRPEDVTLWPVGAQALSPMFGEAVVDHVSFAGSFERLRLRLPPIPGVRPIAPAPPFGADFILVEATRSQDQARAYPLQVGDKASIGIQRIHALLHPGLNFLMLSNAARTERPALELGGQIARLAHARTTLLGHGAEGDILQRHLQEAREKLGSGLARLETQPLSGDIEKAVVAELDRQAYDLVALDYQGKDGLELGDEIMRVGEHHLLLVPKVTPTPEKVLICLAGGEPGKEDVRFAGRLVRHLGAQATLMTVLPADANEEAHTRTSRFLEAGERSLTVLGVPASRVVRQGSVRDEILDEMASGGYDLLVLGAAIPDQEGRGTLGGLIGEILSKVTTVPVLIVRSPAAANRPAWLKYGYRVGVYEEVLP